MLVLSRKVGEELVLGDNIRVKITEISGNRIKVAILAPAEVTIRRGELSASMDDTDEFSVLLVGS